MIEVLLLGFVVSWLLTRLLISANFAVLQDTPNDRSLHHTPMPRSGGIAVLLALLAASLALHYGLAAPLLLNDPWLLGALLLLCGLSFWDDLQSLPPWLRLLGQWLVASLTVFYAGSVELAGFTAWAGQWQPWVAAVMPLLTVLAIVWGINLYNFMDGMDGFAAGMALVGFGVLAVLGQLHGDTVFRNFNSLIVVSVLGFWCWNFPPARIFLGDMAATVLGYFSVVISLLGWQRELYPLWVPLVIFAPFWVDATYTLIKRVIKREKFWLPHRSHFYQRLVLVGLGHRQVVLAEYALMLLGGASVLLCVILRLGYNEVLAWIWLLAYGLIILRLEAALLAVEKE